MDVLEQARLILPEIVEDRRQIHRYPETGMEEYRTCAFIRKRLDEMQIPWIPAGETGTVGILGEGKPVIGLRADIDALDIQEKNDCSYASLIPGKMHACGHDAHTASLLGAARLFLQMQDPPKGTIKLIFQPGEENGKGANSVAASGAVDDCSAFFALHVASSLPTGRCSLSKGVITAGNDRFSIRIIGKSCHSSTPQNGIDALMIAASLVQQMQTMITHRISPFETVCMNIGILQAGTAFNILPGEAKIEGSIRILKEELRPLFRETLKNLVEHTAAAGGARAEVIFENTAGIVINDDHLTEIAARAVRKLIGEENLCEQPPNLGSEDFSGFLGIAPGVYLNVGTGNPEKGTDKPHHNEFFNIDEDGMAICAAAYVQFVLEYLAEF